jgi:hypothetical protein
MAFDVGLIDVLSFDYLIGYARRFIEKINTIESTCRHPIKESIARVQ